jgi:hypothetical protein
MPAHGAHRHRHARSLLYRGDDQVAVVIDVGQRDMAQPQDERGEDDGEQRRGTGREAKNESR